MRSEDGTDQTADAQRQPTPDLDHEAVLGIERIEVRRLLARHELVFVGQGLGMKTPVLFVGIGARTPLAAAKIEGANTALSRTAHHPDVEIVVGLSDARAPTAPGVEGMNLVAKVERHRRREQAFAVADNIDLDARAEH